MPYKAPFPWFGGKSRIADEIWSQVSSPKTYVEPFAGSIAVLLANPHWQSCNEVINDLDGMVTNAWRSIQYDPQGVKAYADWPVSELDLHARSTYCEEAREGLEAKLRSEAHYYDVQLAGYWIWGMSIGIGDTFIKQKKAIPNVAKTGKGVKRRSFDWDEEFEALSQRLKDVKIICGDWKRAVKPSITESHSPTLLFLDPPYEAKEGRHDTYAHESYTVASDVETWCKENESNSHLQIVLAGYSGDYDLPGWREVPWKTMGGYANLAHSDDKQGKVNASKEVLLFSPTCPDPSAHSFLNSFTAGD